MNDLIRRRDAVSRMFDLLMMELKGQRLPTWNEVYQAMNDVPSAEPNLIHCADCRWWKQDEDIAPYGWCFACRSGSYTEHWDITIRRKYQGDFFCADAEPRIEGEDDDEL